MLEKRTILDEVGVNRALTRMSHEILERYKGSDDVVVLGIKRRGEFLAKRIQEKIEVIEGVKVQSISRISETMPREI